MASNTHNSPSNRPSNPPTAYPEANAPLQAQSQATPQLPQATPQPPQATPQPPQATLQPPQATLQPPQATPQPLPASTLALRIGLISISDRASQGVYLDRGLPALKDWLEACLIGPRVYESSLIPDDRDTIQTTLKRFCDALRCHLVLTTGGTGPSRRDVTPEATSAICTRELPGFGEQMRQISLRFVPTAILSRQLAGLRELPDGHTCLIVNLPGQPRAIAETLEGLRDSEGHVLVPGIFAAIPYCLDLIGAPYIDTDPQRCRSFRPKGKNPEA